MMFRTLVNAWKSKDIRTKILYTLLLILLYRLGSYIAIPGVNTASIAASLENYVAVGGFMNLFTGGAFSRYSLFAMGISPYINASIIMQLLTVAIPALERLSKEEDGRSKIEKITRYVGIGLALVQSVSIILAFGEDAVTNANFLTYATIGICCTAGTALLMWMGERITDKGIGNGISFLIFASIVSSVLPTIIDIVKQVFVMGTYQWWALPILIVVVLVLTVGIVMVDRAERRIPIQYAKRVVGRKQYGGQTTYLPIKANANGVMPLIFAMTVMNVPQMIVEFVSKDSGFRTFYENYLAAGTVVYYIIYALLIVAFAYFYTTISFNPVEISKNLQQNGGTIPGRRPGKDTGDYIKRISNRLTLFGALFLMVIAIVPSVLLGLFNLDKALSAFGPTSILIMISVALETSATLESMMLMRHYKGFLG
ncbi:MAG: preprotein translocase subunit SecY [Clostridiales bacterium]|jgi:preprotein translocase subunit SecY|nr:preprotein translocase subunit SecY [Clostridiales bacterium]MDD7414808.1 preprotein translocase subunit SecY [Clostridiales bacterium]MDY5732570.1 preprotein translocase subunit SecY [Eubacteriales bacterium]